MTLFLPALVFVTAAAAAAPPSEWVHRGADGKLVYKTTPAGDRILDFSHAGYMGGGVAIPEVPVKRTVKPSGGDDDAAVIQAALDEVAALPLRGGLRGAVLLAPGEYRCPRPLSLRASGVVLRGSGSAPGKRRSTLALTGKPHVAITVRAEREEETPPPAATSAITDPYVPSGTASFSVADARGFAAGDTVVVTHPVTAAWVKLMQMDDMTRNGRGQTWIRPGSTLTTERRIKAIAGNRITLDVPLADALDARYLSPPGATVARVRPPARVTQVGIEHLHVQSPLQEISHSQPHFSALRLQGEDCWARDLIIDETMNSVAVGGRRITLQEVAVNRQARHQGASKPAEFAPNGSQILLDRCAVSADNVWFVATGGGHAGPMVVLNSTFRGNARAESHQRWSTGILYDSCRAPDGGIELRNRGAMGSGHGWSMGWGVIWNSEAKDYIVQNPPGALNWLIGSIGESKRSARPFGSGPLLPEATLDSPGKHVAPASLYLAQLAERLGPQALRNIGYASSWTGAPLPARPHAAADAPGPLGTNLALDRPVTTSNVRGGERRFAGWQALDDDDGTYWATDDAVTEARLELDTEGALDIDAVDLGEAAGLTGRVRGYRVEGFVDSAWKLLAEGTALGERKVHHFPRVTVWKVRLVLRADRGPAIRKLGLYLTHPTAARGPAGPTGSGRGSPCGSTRADGGVAGPLHRRGRVPPGPRRCDAAR
jgi:hypothetical protein